MCACTTCILHASSFAPLTTLLETPMSAVLFWEYLIGVFPMGLWVVCYLSFIAW
jgi:hypothetical protein